VTSLVQTDQAEWPAATTPLDSLTNPLRPGQAVENS